MKKKNIDTYYHPKAIKRICPNFPEMDLFGDNFCFETFVGTLKQNNIEIGNIKKKNWIQVFNEMTKEEWIEVSNGELETIFENVCNLQDIIVRSV